MPILNPPEHPACPFHHSIVDHQPNGWPMQPYQCTACAWYQGVFHMLTNPEDVAEMWKLFEKYKPVTAEAQSR